MFYRRFPNIQHVFRKEVRVALAVVRLHNRKWRLDFIGDSGDLEGKTKLHSQVTRTDMEFIITQ